MCLQGDLHITQKDRQKVVKDMHKAPYAVGQQFVVLMEKVRNLEFLGLEIPPRGVCPYRHNTMLWL